MVFLMVVLMFNVLVGCSDDDSTPVVESTPTVKSALVESIPSITFVQSNDGNAIEIWVNDVNDLFAAEIEVQFDATQLQVKDSDPDKEGVQIMPGNIPSPDFVAINQTHNQTGTISYAITQLPPSPSKSGSDVLATIYLEKEISSEVLDSIVCNLINLADSDGKPIQLVSSNAISSK